MGRLLDATYLAAAALTSPIWLSRMIRTGKHRTDWSARLGRSAPVEIAGHPRVLVHGVSVGEINAARLLIDQLAAHPRLGSPCDRSGVMISATTDTGVARARALFEPRHAVLRFPFDLTTAVRRFLDAVRPDVVVLVELEVWPN